MATGKGFTLIELLITMVLVGLITGLALLSMGTADPRDQQKLEAERLSRLLALASQEAIASGGVIGLEVFKKGYRFAVLQKKQWQPETKDDLFRLRTLNPQVQMALMMERSVVKLKTVPVLGVDAQPQIFLSPDGEMPLFQIKVTADKSDSVFVVSNSSEDGLLVSTEARR
ncbi:MAG: type II secretion system minor pseudopilin GspH [Methylococcaceae bacterium]|jgi:general secretion pathway protein H